METAMADGLEFRIEDGSLSKGAGPGRLPQRRRLDCLPSPPQAQLSFCCWYSATEISRRRGCPTGQSRLPQEGAAEILPSLGEPGQALERSCTTAAIRPRFDPGTVRR